MKIVKQCPICSSSFTTYNHPVNEKKFCSRKCSSLSQRVSFLGSCNPFWGKKHTNTVKNKIRLSRIGKSSWNKGLKGYGAGKNHPMKRPEIALKSQMNRRLTDAGRLKLSICKLGNLNPAKRKSVRVKISRTMTGKPNPNSSGSKCVFWKGGVSKENDIVKSSLAYKRFIFLVYLRDGYRCRKCHVYGGKLNVHHIRNFSSEKTLRTIVSNGITLCLQCHKEFHKLYGVKNNTVGQIKQFLI